MMRWALKDIHNKCGSTILKRSKVWTWMETKWTWIEIVVRTKVVWVKLGKEARPEMGFQAAKMKTLFYRCGSQLK